MTTEIICQKCNVPCVPYRSMKTVGECPHCHELLTICRGDEVIKITAV